MDKREGTIVVGLGVCLDHFAFCIFVFLEKNLQYLNLMSLINPSLEYVYCSNLVSNNAIIRLIRFVSRFTVNLCNAIYFLTTFSTQCKRFTKNLHCVLGSKQGLSPKINSISTLAAYLFYLRSTSQLNICKTGKRR